jgi:hypothetical protein
MIEEWRPVRGFEKWYDVSNHGKIRSWHTRSANRIKRCERPTVLVAVISSTGYCVINLRGDGGKREQRFIHTVVMDAFGGGTVKGMHVDHVDGDKLNNSITNLENVTPRENTCRGKIRKGNSSGYLGVSKRRTRGGATFETSIEWKGKACFLVSSRDAEFCYRVYKEALTSINQGCFEDFLSDLTEYKEQYRPVDGQGVMKWDERGYDGETDALMSLVKDGWCWQWPGWAWVSRRLNEEFGNERSTKSCRSKFLRQDSIDQKCLSKRDSGTDFTR